MQIDFIEFSTLAIAHFIALISPGPDFILIIGNSLRSGFTKTAWTCLGIASANGIYIFVAICGFSLFREHPLVFSTLKLLAAGYLLYLGILLLRTAPQQQDTRQTKTTEAGAYGMFGRGFLSAILNPKNAIFYLSLMSLIVSSQTPFSHQLGYGLWMFTAVFSWDLLIAWGVGNCRSQNALNRHSWKLERLCGCVLILVGSLIVLQ
jgi:threonine/homoserine/homoserine lactone efflux protein